AKRKREEHGAKCPCCGRQRWVLADRLCFERRGEPCVRHTRQTARRVGNRLVGPIGGHPHRGIVPRGQAMSAAWVLQKSEDVDKLGEDKAPWYVGWYEPDGTRRKRSFGAGWQGKKRAERERGKLENELM